MRGRHAMIGTIALYLLLFIFLGYLIPHLIVAWFYKTKNLKKSYNAEWALVTGASSGEQRGWRGRAALPAPGACNANGCWRVQ